MNKSDKSDKSGKEIKSTRGVSDKSDKSDKNIRKRNITSELLETFDKKFHKNPANIIARNAVTAVGSLWSTTNAVRRNQISHTFLNTIKKKNIKATNQGASGRCWMFAGLNTFRHLIIKLLNLEDFEFSEVYLFFFDKLERSNSYLNWFIENRNKVDYNSKEYDYMVSDYMNDGGWYNTFANLVLKYGLVPRSAMKETFQSEDSDAMNEIIKEILDSTANLLIKKKHEDSEKIKQKSLRQIYDTLIKFLGEPPKQFDFIFSISTDDDEDNKQVVPNLTPISFRDMVVPEIWNSFVSLSNIPNIPYYEKYLIKKTNNIVEGELNTLINLPIFELTKYAVKSISSGFAVWFVSDVGKHFNWFHSTLDDNLDDSKLVFGDTPSFNKAERILLKNTQGTHAMALTGFNLDNNDNVINWQVENSWGFADNETPGLDGFLTMSHSWFEKYVTQIVVCTAFVSRSIKNITKKNPIELEPWDSVAPALKAGGKGGIPRGYDQILHRIKTN